MGPASTDGSPRIQRLPSSSLPDRSRAGTRASKAKPVAQQIAALNAAAHAAAFAQPWPTNSREEHRENGSPEGPSEDPHDAGGAARVGHLALRRSGNAPAMTAMVTGARRTPRMNTDPATTHPLASSGGRSSAGGCGPSSTGGASSRLDDPPRLPMGSSPHFESGSASARTSRTLRSCKPPRAAGEVRACGPGILAPEPVANVVVKAIHTRRPRARYKVGMPPRITPLLYRLPAGLWDALMARMFPFE